MLGNHDDAKKYDDLFAQIKAAFNKAYVAPDGRIKGNTQTCYVMALWFDLLPADKRAVAVKYLVDDIKSRDTHLSTGFVGTSVLMPTLSANGQTPVAYKLFLNDTFPSWGFSIKHGATRHLGTLGRLDARQGIPRPRHELVRPLFVRRGRSLDVPDGPPASTWPNRASSGW